LSLDFFFIKETPIFKERRMDEWMFHCNCFRATFRVSDHILQKKRSFRDSVDLSPLLPKRTPKPTSSSKYFEI